MRTIKQLVTETGKSRATLNRYKKMLPSEYIIIPGSEHGRPEEIITAEGVEEIKRRIKSKAREKCAKEGCENRTKGKWSNDHSNQSHRKEGSRDFNPEMVTICGMKMRKSMMDYNDSDNWNSTGIPEQKIIWGRTSY